MFYMLESDVMRTTVDIDTPILTELKRLRRLEKTTLGRLVSELLADALARRHEEVGESPPFEWHTQAMAAKVDVDDKEALYAALDREP